MVLSKANGPKHDSTNLSKTKGGGKGFPLERSHLEDERCGEEEFGSSLTPPNEKKKIGLSSEKGKKNSANGEKQASTSSCLRQAPSPQLGEVDTST